MTTPHTSITPMEHTDSTTPDRPAATFDAGSNEPGPTTSAIPTRKVVPTDDIA
ncbi:MAG: hypothetical protein JJD93_16815 [Ilumatobacteraceae bacterium]|nr:hypothetical protein [Ilumatobacteraceae bacterium]